MSLSLNINRNQNLDYQREDVKFDRYVRPVVNPMLSDYCKSYTGISQATVDNADTFSKVFDQFCAWLQEHDFQETRYAFVALNRQDLWLVAQYQFLLVKQPLPAMCRRGTSSRTCPISTASGMKEELTTLWTIVNSSQKLPRDFSIMGIWLQSTKPSNVSSE
ncbi:hypothetical protein B9Z55_029004 [Caenorhabditis nigoni]|uniref:Exonuclease domain-containing protein n=1 Tax=Caenorhabditis nigoni TaxID=1611254 RepID=A0A2G5S909_9PELO|nr:hypothetical protein B9Z55_029004 [Caenorhabditis nigoni]